MRKTNRNALFALGVTLAIGSGFEVAAHEPNARPERVVHAILGSTATSQEAETTTTTRVPTSATSTTKPESLAKPAADPSEQYAKTEIMPLVEAAGLKIVKPINEDSETVNQPGEFIVTSDEAYGVQFYVSPSNDHRDPAQTMNISIRVFGNLSILRNGKVEGAAEYGSDTPDFHHAEDFLEMGCNYDPAKPDDAVKYIVDTEAEISRAMSTNTPINVPGLVQNLLQVLPATSFLGNFSNSIL